MIPNSLRFRLLGAAVIVLVIALQFAGAALFVLFERNIIRQAEFELETDIEQLAANITRTDGGGIDMPLELADPRFRQPFAGRYWQITAGETTLRSRSLWDAQLAVAVMPQPRQGVRYATMKGPDRQLLLVAARTIVLDAEVDGQGDLNVGLVVAADKAEIETLKRRYLGDMLTALGLLAVLLFCASWAQVSVGLHPFELLRTGLENVRLGKAKRLVGGMPRELEPLVAETNRLLDAQESAIERARARAGDLAHGVKTPLTALTILARQLREEGRGDLSRPMEEHLAGIAAHVERELARARMAAGSGVDYRTAIEPVLSRLVRTMHLLPRGDEIEWLLSCEPGLVAALDETDLVEALGNLIDNARKWARTQVRVDARAAGAMVEIAIADDGPGVADGEHAHVLRRGMRLDETKPGSGLGLSIVSEIAETYGGSIAMGRSACQGLEVRLTLPVQRIQPRS